MVERISRIAARVFLVAGIALAAGLLVFVRPPKTGRTDRTIITTWRVTGAEEEEPAVTNWFNESQDRIWAQPVGLPFLEIEQKFLTSVVGGIPPDVLEYFGSVAQWSARGALMPLDDFMERDGFDKSAIFAPLWEEMTFNGRIYAIPTGTGDEAFYWNKQHFREAGLDPEAPPETWDDLTTFAKRLTKYEDGKITRAGYIPGYWSAGGAPLFLNWPVQLGARFLSADGTRVVLDTTASIEALKWEGDLFRDLGRDELIRKRASFGYGSQQGFLSGQLSMIVQKSSFPPEIKKFAPNLEYGCAPLPYPKNGRRGVIAGCVWAGIPSGARHPEAAWEMIKYLSRGDIQVRGAEWSARRNLTAFFPSNIAAAKSDFVMSQPNMDVFVKSMEWGYSSTVVPLAHGVFWRCYVDVWDRVMRGVDEPATALRRAQSEVQMALDNQLAYSRFYQDHLRTAAAAASAGARR
jgi:ABC-type glycerol-3-phosphate transport system substrate-binding protein